MRGSRWAAILIGLWLLGWVLLTAAAVGLMQWAAPGLPSWSIVVGFAGGLLVYETIGARNVAREAHTSQVEEPEEEP